MTLDKFGQYLYHHPRYGGAPIQNLFYNVSVPFCMTSRKNMLLCQLQNNKPIYLFPFESGKIISVNMEPVGCVNAFVNDQLAENVVGLYLKSGDKIQFRKHSTSKNLEYLFVEFIVQLPVVGHETLDYPN